VINLKGKVAVVTGGASGIGRACVLRMVEAGATVHFGDIDEVGGAETAALAGTGSATFHPLDVTDRDQIERFATDVAASPAVDIIVNVAGWDRVQPFLDATPEFMDQILDINLKGPMNIVKAFLPPMLESALIAFVQGRPIRHYCACSHRVFRRNSLALFRFGGWRNPKKSLMPSYSSQVILQVMSLARY
jgi:NAD(P)-dependent dehydrogenase (short-subunit alcohol dehydrogenase family)